MARKDATTSRQGSCSVGKKGSDDGPCPEEVSQTATTVTSQTETTTPASPPYKPRSRVNITKASPRSYNDTTQPTEVTDESPISRGSKHGSSHPFENMVVTIDADGSSASINYDEITVEDPTEEQNYFSYNHHSNPRQSAAASHKEDQQPLKNYVWKRGPNGRYIKVPKASVELDQVAEEQEAGTAQQQKRRQRGTTRDMERQMRELSIGESLQRTASRLEVTTFDLVVEPSLERLGNESDSTNDEHHHHASDDSSSRYSQRYEPELRRDDEYYRHHPYTPDYAHDPTNYGGGYQQQLDLNSNTDTEDSSSIQDARWKVERTTSGLSALSNNSYGSRASSTARIGFFHLPDMGESYHQSVGSTPSATNSEASSRQSNTNGGKKFEWKRGPNGRFMKVPIEG
mmetsp:Transcript_20067/g.43188  ORF Transcript_20067/g.43188 Transcript_20067/m.43188 type:complete len:401 (-) Transcript_20067:296-1498(-)